MEAIKPLIVLGLFGTILYGAYSVVQKGPSPEAGQIATTDAPAFAPPAVEVPPPVAAPSQPVPPPPTDAAATSASPLAPAAVVDAAPPAPPVATPPVPAPPPPAVAAATAPPTTPPAAAPPAMPVSPPVPPPADAGLTEAAVATAAVAGLAAAAGATAAAAATDPVPPVAAPGAPTYLAAESAPPPAQDDVPPTAPATDRPERFATVAPPAAASLPPEMPPPPGTLPSSAAFATAWADAHDKLTAGRYAEALTALSVWYDDPSLGLEESHRLEDLLGQLAGTVIYSQQDLLLPPHVVAPGETLPAIAAPLGVSWQLLAKINGVSDPMQLVPGEHLKVIRGPFDAVVSVARRRISLQVGGAYAGSFPVSVGREFLPRVGTALPVAEVRRDAAVQPVAAPTAGPAIVLADGLSIQGADDPAVVTEDAAPASLVVSVRDLTELLDILGPGSRILIRQ